MPQEREYQSYKKKELAEARKDFENHLGTARNALTEVSVAVASFTPAETSDIASPMAAFGKLVTEKSKALTSVIQHDLAAGLGRETLAGQNKVIAAIAAAEEEVSQGLSSLHAWKVLEGLKQGLSSSVISAIEVGITKAHASAAECLELLEKSRGDSKFQMKVVAAQWHARHHSGAISSCPLCEHDIVKSPSLVTELEALRSAGNAAARQFDDNVNAIITELNVLIPGGGEVDYG
jgi:hypothetical protein